MPSNKNAVIRYMYLDQMLSDRYHKYTCEELLKKVNERLKFDGFPTIGGEQSDYEHYIKSGKRVIQMDLQALQDSPFNMEIDSSEKLDGAPVYRYADQAQSLFSKPLSDDEKRLLQEVLNTLGQFSGLDNFEWLDDLQEKLNDRKSFGGSEFYDEDRSERKIISFSSNNYLKGKDYLGTLFTLIAHKKVVDVKYEPFGEDVITIRLYPYLLKQYNERWYLIGTQVESNPKAKYINLALDRILGIHSVEGVPYIDCEEDLEERYEDIVGITYEESKPLTCITLAVKNSELGYMDTKPIHGSQTKLPAERQASLHQQYPLLTGYTFYELTVKPNWALFSIIYRNRNNILLVRPAELRQVAIEELEGVVNLLKGLD